MKQNLLKKTLIVEFDENDNFKTVDDFFEFYCISRKNRYLYYVDKKVMLNNRIITQSAPINCGDILKIDTNSSEGVDFEPQYFNLHVLYEDEIVMVVDKPSGIIVYPENKDGQDTLYNYVSYYYQVNQLNIPIRAVHRLDKFTSGCILFCKNQFFQAYLDHCIEEKIIHRNYLAVVEGKIRSLKGAVRINIARDRHDSHKMRICTAEEGKEAVTRYQTLRRNDKFSVIYCTLETGRTHQVRLSMLHLKNPILSDELYGNPSPMIQRCALHAYSISWIDPLTRQTIKIKAPVPHDMKRFMETIDLTKI